MARCTQGWLLRGFGYLLYVLLAAALLLWLLFPREAIQRLLAGYLNSSSPTLQWRVGSVTLHAPLRLTMEAIEGYGKEGERTPLIRVDSLVLWPEWMASLTARAPRLGYGMRIGKGRVDGSIRADGGLEQLVVQGTVRELQLADWPLLALRLGRDVKGMLGASFTGTVAANTGQIGQVEARVRIENGQMALKRPILSHGVLPFSALSMTVRGDGARVHVQEGTAESGLFRCRFSGTLELNEDLAVAQLAIRGSLQPEAGFFKGVKSGIALQAFRAKLQDAPLPFRLSGELADPGIHFEEFSLLVQTLEKELR